MKSVHLERPSEAGKNHSPITALQISKFLAHRSLALSLLSNREVNTNSREESQGKWSAWLSEGGGEFEVPDRTVVMGGEAFKPHAHLWEGGV